jgi:hypothetical protein
MYSKGIFDEPIGIIPGPLGFLLADLHGKIGPQRLDYAPPANLSDHDHMRKMIR